MHIRYHDVMLVLVGSTRNDEDRALVASLQTHASDLDIAENVSFVVNAPFSVLHKWLGDAQIGLHTMWNEHFGISIVEMMAAGLITVAHHSGGPLMDLIHPADTHSSQSTSRQSDSIQSESANCVAASEKHVSVSDSFDIPLVPATSFLSANFTYPSSSTPGPSPSSSTTSCESNGYLATTATEYARCMGAAFDSYPHSLSLRERARKESSRFSDEVFERIIVKEFSKLIN